MGRFARRSLVLILAMALIVGGLPLAHAMPCASFAHPVEMAHQHDGSQASPEQHRHDGHGKTALGVCKCLNCGMCATAYVAPLLREATPERREFAVRYVSASAQHPTTLTFVDPGIPIAMA